MTKLLNIMPITFMRKYFLEDNLDKSCIVMAHLILDSKEYLALIREIKSRGIYIVLDNSTPYLGKSVSHSNLLECIKLVNPDEVILPDVINDYKETIKLTEEFIKILPDKGNIKFMAVPQGKTLKEYIKCYKSFSQNPLVDSIGLSFSVSDLFSNRLPNKDITYRENLINLLVDKNILNYSIPHHLLGLADSGNVELKRLSKYSFIKRSDSNAGYKTANSNILLVNNKHYSKPNEPIDFFAKFDKEIYNTMKKNILVLNQSANSKEKYPFVVKDSLAHTMEDQLYDYIETKMHHLIMERDFGKIIIKGKYDRRGIVGNNEKDDKLFNWQRPTAKIKGNTLIIFVPTGRDYLMHYASLIATYLAMNGRRYDHVSYLEPSLEECESLVLESNLKAIQPKKIVIVGFGLTDIEGFDSWKGEGAFLYKHKKLGINELTLLGCKHSLWGDISKFVTRYLAKKLGVKCLIYIGKLGSINKKISPNAYLATGGFSFVNGEEVLWDNLFNEVNSPILIKGRHYTSPSILLEDKKWLSKNRNFDFVDPEIGHFAKEAIKSEIKFSYLHIISNNLAKKHEENLSNEREKKIKEKRSRLIAEIKKILSVTDLSKNI